MDVGEQIQSVAVALAIVIGVMLLLAYGARMLRGRAQRDNSDLEIISSTYVGPKERLLLVRVQNRQILLGVGPQSICALGEFTSIDSPAGPAGDRP